MRSIRGQFAHPIITWAQLLTDRVADCRSSSPSAERPLYNAGQPSRFEGLLRIVVPPFSARAWLTLIDPYA